MIDAVVWWQWVYPAAALAVLSVLFFLGSRLGRGPFAAVAFFAVTLVPALGFVNIYPMKCSFVADHFQCLASIGLIVLATVAATHGARVATLPEWARTAGCVLVVLVLGTLTLQQTKIYRDAETLWRATIERNPSAWIAYNNLGIILDDQGRLDEAVAVYTQSLRLKPEYVETHNNLSISFVRLGRLDAAEQHMREAIRLRPLYRPFFVSLATILERQGKIDEAVEVYRGMLDSWPWYDEARVNLADLLVGQGRQAEAALLNAAPERN